MVSIVTSFEQICLSCQLPDCIEISTDSSESINVEILANNQVIFETDISPYNQEANFYDMREVVEQFLDANKLVYAQFDFQVTQGQSDDSSSAIAIVRSDIDIPETVTWLRTHYLTTRESFAISPTGSQQLTFFAQQGEIVTSKIEATIIRPNGSQAIYTSTTSTQTLNEGVYTLDINVENVQSMFEQNGTVITFAVFRNDRIMNFYIIDEPNFSFRFLNNFNAQEYAEVKGTRNIKHKKEANDAKIIRKTVLYDINKETSYEIETTLLARQEALWLGQMMQSRDVQVETNGQWRDVVIDGETDISDNVEKETRVKFGYQYATDIQSLDF